MSIRDGRSSTSASAELVDLDSDYLKRALRALREHGNQNHHQDDDEGGQQDQDQDVHPYHHQENPDPAQTAGREEMRALVCAYFESPGPGLVRSIRELVTSSHHSALEGSRISTRATK